MKGVKYWDYNVKIFMGSSYDLRDSVTIGEFRKTLEYIISDLPDDDSLKIAEIFANECRLEYILEDGIVQ